MMKRTKKMRTSVSSLLVLVVMVFSLALLASGCSQPGETTAEGSRRHSRNLRINQQEMMADIDAFLLLDKPSKLTDKRVP
ncbi:MAG: hypothetical protein ACYS8I_13175 [Planctomycetota bacterium]|jgi:hypothetical protein